MANDLPVVRAARMFWRNRKALETYKVSLSIKHNRRAVIFGPENREWSQGFADARLTFEEFIPVGGSTTTKDLERIFQQNYVDVAVQIGARWYRQNWAVIENEMSSDSETGVCTGRYTLEGIADFLLLGAQGKAERTSDLPK
ncbi:MAG: hypothetical protein JST00_31685 [Deltaproteobacteria bacterium]|nr:hypothetical protein [Deltaproteobacteria bacterium]